MILEKVKNRDPKLCAKAVQDFWDSERELVKQGKGTRDWTIEQQIEIMNFKKNGEERLHAGAPTDENGDAFEGQHMKSAEAYPQYQARGDNIQALTREEHQVAHDDNFQNATNWYYDPITGEKTEFGNAEPSKPEPINLSPPPYVKTDAYKMHLAETALRRKKPIKSVTNESSKPITPPPPPPPPPTPPPPAGPQIIAYAPPIKNFKPRVTTGSVQLPITHLVKGE